MSISRRNTDRTPSGLIARGLAICEKFTTLHKGIVNRSDIVRPVKNIGFKIVLIAITLLNTSITLLKPNYKLDTIVIDAGHGGKDPGTRGQTAKEKDVALKISLKLGA